MVSPPERSRTLLTTHAQVVLKDVIPAIPVADQVGSRDVAPDPPRRIQTMALLPVGHSRENHFARDDAVSWFPEGVVDFTFIDGLHLFEFALRDFMNTERLSTPSSVVVFDDVLPRSASEAARQQHTLLWAGDTYKVTAVLERYRPDLTTVLLDTEPTGLLLVLGLNPASTALGDHYDEIVTEYTTDDPQPVPDEILHRRTAADPQSVADSPVWGELATARETGAPVPHLGALQ